MVNAIVLINKTLAAAISLMFFIVELYCVEYKFKKDSNAVLISSKEITMPMHNKIIAISIVDS